MNVKLSHRLHGFGDGFFAHGGLRVSLPEDSINISLNITVMRCSVEAFLSETTIRFVNFNSQIASTELLRHDRCRSGAIERIKNQLTRSRTGEDDLRQQFLGLLRRVVGVFRH